MAKLSIFLWTFFSDNSPDPILFMSAVILGTLCLFMFWGLYFICVCCPSGDFMFIQVLGILCQLFLCIVILRTECLLQSLWGVCTRCLRIRSCIVLGLVDNYYFCKLSFIVLFHVNFVSINIFKVECFIGLLVYLKLFLPWVSSSLFKGIASSFGPPRPITRSTISWKSIW